MKILVGMSGGLDSTYSAYTLIKEGHVVEGAVLKMGDFTDISGAEKAAKLLKIKLNVIDCEKEFIDIVIENFVNEYMNGRTPNPCTVCNRYIKIKYLCAFARENGFDKAVTGHYANICCENGRYFVRRGSDLRKDQSYMLWKLTQEELSMLYTPLAGINKADIREEAKKCGLEEFASLPESQEVCFVPDNDYAGFIERMAGKIEKGDFVDENGKVLGKHKGIIYYTIGQKKGLGIALGKPYTVTKVDAKDNTVTIVPAEKTEAVYTKTCRVAELNFQAVDTIEKGSISGCAKIRYAADPVEAVAKIENGTAVIEFEREVRAVTPGQSLVFYRGNDILFGGVIL